jgi:hypothetical protein
MDAVTFQDQSLVHVSSFHSITCSVSIFDTLLHVLCRFLILLAVLSRSIIHPTKVSSSPWISDLEVQYSIDIGGKLIAI